jgi:hypothetical protein
VVVGGSAGGDRGGGDIGGERWRRRGSLVLVMATLVGRVGG